MVFQTILLSLSLIFSSAPPTTTTAPVGTVDVDFLSSSSTSFLNSSDQESSGMLKLREAGMSETSLNGLKTLNKEFREGFPRVAGSQRTIDRFLADFQLGTRLFVESMSRRDREIYEEHSGSL